MNCLGGMKSVSCFFFFFEKDGYYVKNVILKWEAITYYFRNLCYRQNGV